MALGVFLLGGHLSIVGNRPHSHHVPMVANRFSIPTCVCVRSLIALCVPTGIKIKNAQPSCISSMSFLHSTYTSAKQHMYDLKEKSSTIRIIIRNGNLWKTVCHHRDIIIRIFSQSLLGAQVDIII